MRPAHRPPELLVGPFTTAEAAASGVTRAQLRSACWRRLLYEVHCSAALEDSIGLRVEAIGKVLPPGAVISGATAAWVMGVAIRRRTDEPITVTYPRSNKISSRRGIAVRHALLPDSDVTLVGGIAVTTPVRTAFDLARQPNLIEGVVGLDAFLNAQLIAKDNMASYIADHPKWRGVRLAARALALTEPKAESPMETRLRLVIVIPGLPPPEPQITLCGSAGNEVARIDLGHRKMRKGYEYDGRGHAATFGADSYRRNSIWYDFGWDLRHYTGVDVYRRPQTIVAQVARGLGLPPPPFPPIMLDWLARPRR